jgi:hypothetical protein
MQLAFHNWYPYVIQNGTNGTCYLPANADASTSACGAGYSQCLWANDLAARLSVDYIHDHAHDAKPFFLYFATTTPHAGDLKGANTSYPTPAPYSNR